MDYNTYIDKNRRELETLRHLLRVYLPPFLKEDSVKTVSAAINLMDQYKERLQRDLVDIPDPF